MRLINRTAALLTLLFIFAFSARGLMAQANPVQFVKDSLENGLQVIYHVDKSAPVVATVLHYRVGSKDEDPSRTGFAHFFEHLMFEATDDIPRASMDKYVQEAGGSLNAHTAFDETVYQFKLPSNEVKLALWIESQRMRKLHVNEIGVETQRGVVKEERKTRVDNQPYGNLLEKMAKELFKGGSYSWTPIGSEQHIDIAAIEEFKAFYNSFYQPNNATLVVAGDFEITEVKKYVKDYFGHYERAPEPARSEFKLLPLEKEYRETIKDDKATLPAVFMGYRGPKLGSDDYYAMNLLTDIMAAGESSRMYRKLVDEKELAIQTAVIPFSLQHSGMILLYGIPNMGVDVTKVEKEMYKVIDRIVKDGVTDDELQKARNIKEAQSVEGKKSVLRKA
ncbi:MAG: M16 family metallopeptidase, partial [Bacteroidota bacterium]